MILQRIRLWIRSFICPDRLELELEEEFHHHLELETEKNVREGMSPKAARRKAILDFGGVERFKEQRNRRETHEAHGTRRTS